MSLQPGLERVDELVVEDRPLTDIEVTEGERTLGVGTQERRVIRVPGR